MGRIASSIILFLCLSACVLSERGDGFAEPQLRILDGPGAPPTRGSNKRTASLSILSPQEIWAAYNMNTATYTGAGKKIGIIDAYGCSTCQSDYTTFCNQWGLKSGSFVHYTQTGALYTPGSIPDNVASNWGFEATMDIQAAHAMAPNATIYLISCASSSFNDLFAGVTTAINLGVNAISMSWGGLESSGIDSAFDKYFSNANIPYFASTGDNGEAGGIIYPSSSSKVIAVGGTSLYTTNGVFSSEVAWTNGGGGCSAYTPALSAQTFGTSTCKGKKALPDISCLADPNSGLQTYYSGPMNNVTNPCTPPNCWYGGGGTSLSAPMMAGRAVSRGIMNTPSLVYTGGYSFRDITSGNDGNPATVGEDLATGRGSLLG